MIGIIQGRLTYTKKKLQWFPKNPLREFALAKKLNYDFIEFFAEKNINKKNPIWSNAGIKNYIKEAQKNKLKIYSFCDDYYIKNYLGNKKTLNYALNIIKRLKLLKVKKYIIPLYGKSFLNKKNKQNAIKNISHIGKICIKYKIELLLESNMSPKNFFEIKKKILHKNCFFLFDTGNRVTLKRNFDHLCKTIPLLKPKSVLPFAGAYVIGGKNFEKNEYLGTTTWDDCAEYLIKNLKFKTNIFCLMENQIFDLI